MGRRIDSHGTGHVVPNKVGVVTEGNEGETDSSGDGVGEQRDGLDDRPHVLGGLVEDVDVLARSKGKRTSLSQTHLGVSILERSDGSEDLRESDESVSSNLRPNVDGSGVGLREEE